ncbi:MAG: hypothetical protein QM760_21665 [Nibricoccus sp.]
MCPHLQVGEEAVELLQAVLGDVAGQTGVVLVALDVGERDVGEAVVLDGRAGVALQVHVRIRWPGRVMETAANAGASGRLAPLISTWRRR